MRNSIKNICLAYYSFLLYACTANVLSFSHSALKGKQICPPCIQLEEKIYIKFVLHTVQKKIRAKYNWMIDYNIERLLFVCN